MSENVRPHNTKEFSLLSSNLEGIQPDVMEVLDMTRLTLQCLGFAQVAICWRETAMASGAPILAKMRDPGSGSTMESPG